MKYIIAIVTFLTIFSCSDKSSSTKLLNSDAEVLVHDNINREYVLHVPNSYDANTAVPVVFNFHGYGGTASDHLSTADMRSLADAENFILVYPQGTLLDGFPHWNAGLATSGNKSTADDLGFIEALIEELASNYNIDSERIYACGYSNGAMFSYALACYRSDKIAAVGSVSGTMLEETISNCNPTHPTPIIHIHGTSDTVIPYDGGTGYASVANIVSYWTTFNNTNTTPVTNEANDNGTTISYFLYANGDNDTSVEHYKVNGGAHVWFRENYNESNTNQLIWDFVSKYNINGLIE